MGTKVNISVIIVTYLSEHEIGPCLDSLFGSLEGFSSQIIVVDNNSADGTKHVIKERISSLPKGRFELIENRENLGFTRAVNQGLRICTGEYILFLNPDTEVSSDAISRLVKFLSENPRAGVVAPQLRYSDGRVQPSCRRFPCYRDLVFEILGLSYLFPRSGFFNRWRMGDFDHATTTSVDQPQGACLLTRRDVVQEVGLLDEGFPMFFSDVDWCHRVKEKGWKIVFNPNAQVIHHKGVSVHQAKAAMIWSAHRSFYRYFKKYYPNQILNWLVGAILIKAAILRIIFRR